MRSPGILIPDILSQVRPRFTGPDTSLFRQAVAAMGQKPGKDTQRTFAAIEALRSQLLADETMIPVADYGAGPRSGTQQTSETIKDICRTASKSPEACMLLYQILIRLKPDHAIELGACLGISAAYQAAALQQNNKGYLLTIEGSPGRARVAKATLQQLYLEDSVQLAIGKFEDVLSAELAHDPQIDYAFIDGHHEENATLQYFNMLLPYFRSGGIMVFDDIYWSTGMNRAWKAIKTNPALIGIMEYKGMGMVMVK